MGTADEFTWNISEDQLHRLFTEHRGAVPNQYNNRAASASQVRKLVWGTPGAV